MLQPVAREGKGQPIGKLIIDLCRGQFSRPGEAEFPHGTPVSYRMKRGRIYGVITGHNPNDVNRVRVSYFDRVNWKVRHEWKDKQILERVENKTASR